MALLERHHGKGGQALLVLDLFHITSHLNKTVAGARRAENGQLRAAGMTMPEWLKTGRWTLLRRGSRVRRRSRRQLSPLLNSPLGTAQDAQGPLEHFWTYRSLTGAGNFEGFWTWRVLRSRLEPMKKVARMLQKYENLLMNWFKTTGESPTVPSAGLNNKIRVVTRRSCGFRTYGAMKIAMCHTLGLPEPEEFTHRFGRPGFFWFATSVLESGNCTKTSKIQPEK